MTDLITYTRRHINPYSITADDICILDIAHSLSQTCRYNGHCQEFYSVAQHSVHVSIAVDDEHALWGLLHDAAEAYIGDIIRPVKKELLSIRILEERILKKVAKAFKLPWPTPPNVTATDNDVLEWELERFTKGQPLKGGMQPKPAKNLFLSQFKNLAGQCPCGCNLEYSPFEGGQGDVSQPESQAQPSTP